MEDLRNSAMCSGRNSIVAQEAYLTRTGKDFIFLSMAAAVSSIKASQSNTSFSLNISKGRVQEPLRKNWEDIMPPFAGKSVGIPSKSLTKPDALTSLRASSQSFGTEGEMDPRTGCTNRREAACDLVA